MPKDLPFSGIKKKFKRSFKPSFGNKPKPNTNKTSPLAAIYYEALLPREGFTKLFIKKC
jgi:hypothetical protein